MNTLLPLILAVLLVLLGCGYAARAAKIKPAFSLITITVITTIITNAALEIILHIK